MLIAIPATNMPTYCVCIIITLHIIITYPLISIDTNWNRVYKPVCCWQAEQQQRKFQKTSLVPVSTRFGHDGNKGLFDWKLEEEEDKIFRASPIDYSSFSSILKICSFGNEMCSSRLPIPSPIPNFIWWSPNYTFLLLKCRQISPSILSFE